jgi:hypothetical protein
LKRSAALSFVSVVVLVSGCSTLLGESPTDTVSGTSHSSSIDEEPGSADSCVRFTGDHSNPVNTGSAATDALTLSGETFVCADDVVVVGLGDLNELSAAAQLAAAVSGPLLFPEPRLRAELGRLKPERVHVVGEPDVVVPLDAATVSHDVESALELTMETLGVDEAVALPDTPDASTIVETILAIDAGSRVAVPGPQIAGTSTSQPSLDVAQIVRSLAVATESQSVWMVDASIPETLLLASAVGRTLDASVLAIDSEDVLGYPEVRATLDGVEGESTRFVGAMPETSQWELAVLANGEEIPGGGFQILPEADKRRYVAFYGHPQTTALGVLGEQGPAETVERMRGFISDYAGDGSDVVPTFEIIASVASAGPTDDNDNSYEWPIETFQEWIDYAAENDMYVVLDLQSGHDDFLSQAVQYEELLRLPFVGLALDPEWRLAPGQAHLEQIGRVEAAEVNEVINWLADLVRDNGLPQKMIIVHQFLPSMILNRQDLIQRPELQLIVQMDGDGTEAQKDGTWRQVLQGADDVHWAWGWKNFFDQDEPGPPPPESVMSKIPTPIYVSYQ